MGWIINKYESSHCRTGAHFGYDDVNDTIIQKLNIMLDLHKLYTVFELKDLVATGVNIFNIDRTVYNDEFFNKILNNIQALESNFKNEMYPNPYYRPISLSVTMSIHNPVAIHKRIDFIIFKDVTISEELIEYKRNIEIKSIPILICLTEMEIQATDELIKFSDGIILDLKLGTLQKEHQLFLKKCFEACKPVFYFQSDLIKDYYDETGNDMKLLGIAGNIIGAGFAGVVLVDSDTLSSPPTEIVNAITKAMDIIGNKVDSKTKYFKLSMEIQTPLLAPLTVALASNLAAIQINAGAIIVITRSGQSARLISFTLPSCLVIAITDKISTARKMQIYKGVLPLLFTGKRAHSWSDECRNRVVFGTDFALTNRLLQTGAKLVVLGPSQEGAGYCDSFYITSISMVYCVD